MKGTLYICATPIGNLEDITIRALNILKEVDYIACEDTRRTIKLLNHYGIKTPLISYHEHNKLKRETDLTEKLNAGNNVALVSDAGMPCISDPGASLVKLCGANGIKVTAIPGASAAICALALSGLTSGPVSGTAGSRFYFEGFLPTHNSKRKEILNRLKTLTCPVVFYESPHRLKDVLKEIFNTFGDRSTCLARELTKIHEEVITMPLSNIIDFYENIEPKGEFVLITEGADENKLLEETRQDFKKIPIENHIKMYTKEGFSEKEALKKAAKDRGVSKRDLYKKIIGRD